LRSAASSVEGAAIAQEGVVATERAGLGKTHSGTCTRFGWLCGCDVDTVRPARGAETQLDLPDKVVARRNMARDEQWAKQGRGRRADVN
jgi:hypothetical protein